MAVSKVSAFAPIVFKNMGVGEMLARCDPDKAGRGHWTLLRAEAEVAGCCEQANLLGSREVAFFLLRRIAHLHNLNLWNLR